MISKVFDQILRLVERGDVRISDHGYDELAADGLSVQDAVATIRDGVVVEDYPDLCQGTLRFGAPEGPQRRAYSRGVGYPERQFVSSCSHHRIPTGSEAMGERWEPDFLRRKK